MNLRFPSRLLMRLLLALTVSAMLVQPLAAADTDTPSHHPTQGQDQAQSPTHLRPISETLTGLDLTGLEALPVQHGGRYKPLFSLALEVMDAINGHSTIGAGQTPVSSLLDLLFCNESYLDQPIISIRQSELSRDLALFVPKEVHDQVHDQGVVQPQVLRSRKVLRALESIGRQMSKAKAVNQLSNALQTCDPRYLIEQLRILPLPAGEHSDFWREPVQASASFTTALADFVHLAQGEARLGEATKTTLVERYSSTLSWTTLPLSEGTTSMLKLGDEDQQEINTQVLWPLWQAAAAGTITTQALPDLDALVSQGHFSEDQRQEISSALRQLDAAWPRLGVANADLAQASSNAAFVTALTHAQSAWTGLGLAWAKRRLVGGDPKEVQVQADALVLACHDLLDLYNTDRAQRKQPPLVMDTRLELTYWHLHGFSFVAWLFLCAVPLLALGSIGRSGIALVLGYALFTTGFACQIAAFIIRGILAQRIPLANLYESLAAASLLCSLVAVVGETVMTVRRRRALRESALRQPTGVPGSLALGASLFGGIVVIAQFFLEYNDINAFISPQMPILSEFWLRVHTSCVVSSYGLISLGGLMSLAYLCMRGFLPFDDERCIAWDRTTFVINAMATVVLWVGLCLGAVWAAESWGRPWGWDPKEVFALLTWVVFIMLVHLRAVVSPRRRAMATALVSLSAFVVMAFNWYIVNVVLAGLHSYA